MSQDYNNTRHGLSIRGDSYYCPLSFSLDSYWNCEIECLHCYLRRLNHIWGKELRPANPELLRERLVNGLINPEPRSALAWAIKNKNTIRFGNKSDPFQPAERIHRTSRKLLNVLIDLDWTFVIQTKNTEILMEYSGLLARAQVKNLMWIIPEISPGLEKDWEVFERKLTTNPIKRLEHIKGYKQSGVNGEPFIPGYHTTKDFEDTMKLLKSYGVKTYNTYNLHFNNLVAKNFAKIGLDIEKIWTMNQDKYWKIILQKLFHIADKYEIACGCPDFVNSGWKREEPANTCCGLDVPNPTKFNTHFWKKMIQNGETCEYLIQNTWDGVGNKEMGQSIIEGTARDKYTLKDIV